jgi:hypothetical protein
MAQRIVVIAVGRAQAASPESVLFARYAARLKPPLRLVEVADGTEHRRAADRRGLRYPSDLTDAEGRWWHR